MAPDGHCGCLVANPEVAPRGSPKSNCRSFTAFRMTLQWVEGDGARRALWPVGCQSGSSCLVNAGRGHDRPGGGSMKSRMRWDNVFWDKKLIFIPDGKTMKARRRVPLSERVRAAMKAGAEGATSEWVFPCSRKKGAQLVNERKADNADENLRHGLRHGIRRSICTGGRKLRDICSRLLILLAASQGFEPRYAAPEAAVLPLNDEANYQPIISDKVTGKIPKSDMERQRIAIFLKYLCLLGICIKQE